jgi:hypothetical protein
MLAVPAVDSKMAALHETFARAACLPDIADLAISR